MKTKDYIDHTVDHLFKTRNEQQLLRAFFYRVTLNMNVDEVAKELNISQIKVNLLTRSVDSYRLRKYGFEQSFLKTKEAIENYATYKVSKRNKQHVQGVANRLSFKHKLLITKQTECNANT